MAWPSGTKASTGNVDQGGDKISLARADIKQNIDNVNDIIDHLNIASPSDGDILKYSSSSGKWEQVAATSINACAIVEFMRVNKGGLAFEQVMEDSAGSSIFAWPMTNVLFNSVGLVQHSDSALGYLFSLPAGTYTWEWVGLILGGSAFEMGLYNYTDDAWITYSYNNERNAEFNRIDVSGNIFPRYQFVPFTLSATKEIFLRTNGTNPNFDARFRIYKLA